ncbi:XrtB/PEP-CTERM-associated polysaccharide biosynthesis outer membrane protein EpsL [Denitromonas ohlonensis]|uniref:XrtB/PEP-CTERM-associated polysaccharide biosynthesis outer membrane protein EpsL n=1 Tax=Denitromonas ohlonensis TaxID=3078508 RepID=UPI003704182D
MLGALLLPAGAMAADDTFSLTAGQVFQFDDNVYRVAPGVRPFGQSQSDRISITSLRADFDRQYSLQRVRASANFARIGFQRFDTLNYDTQGGELRWDWALGRRLTGRLSVDQSQSARDLADVGGSRSSIGTSRSLRFSGDYWWHPDWSVGAGIERFSSTYSDVASQTSDYEALRPELRLTYRPRSGNQIALVGRFTDGTYPNRQAGVLSDDGFEQTDLQLSGRWQLTGHSRLNGYAGVARRQHPNLTYRDYTGPTGRLTYDWTPTGKLAVSATLRREIGARDDLFDNFVVTRAASFTPSWAVSGRVLVQGTVEWRKRDFRGDPGLLSGSQSRDDITRTYSLSLSYTPIDPLRLAVSIGRYRRSSDDPNAGYTANVGTVSAQYLF